jgi:hypothetical protein
MHGFCFEEGCLSKASIAFLQIFDFDGCLQTTKVLKGTSVIANLFNLALSSNFYARLVGDGLAYLIGEITFVS